MIHQTIHADGDEISQQIGIKLTVMLVISFREKITPNGLLFIGLPEIFSRKSVFYRFKDWTHIVF